MDWFGRRPLLLLGSVIMTVSHIIIVVLVGLYLDSLSDHKDKGWVAVAFPFLYMMTFEMTGVPFYGPCHLKSFPAFCERKAWRGVPEATGSIISSLRQKGGVWKIWTECSEIGLQLQIKLEGKKSSESLKQNDGRMKQEEAKTV
ncbi:uncharacterized protein Z519_11404 [Cladophialophora bantiana CBS 173.52]|uniref:Major facilitator superfamily (MFS) profile domain-containing protein n=1 Tax=Cladophialophora bantiana (strain ATCC 10958 / CBS 173.52 / CDC B-1940 / NIH 8579) TaxID=1442370 RepID=A0A0D2HA83_CLAB1|nr:uncharacterized protein Z519_11404 [Cladophialophora bantiana CBS 173.52]KIW87820.1 hypothetical protein Z519_11404 [Cladophialophora bantiana CBS 173.52]